MLNPEGLGFFYQIQETLETFLVSLEFYYVK